MALNSALDRKIGALSQFVSQGQIGGLLAAVKNGGPLEYFRRVASRPCISEVSGEIPSSWPNLISSLPTLWPPITPATNTLLSAEKFAAINDALGYAGYPGPELDTLWKSLLEALERICR